jgi:hypothetical protein
LGVVYLFGVLHEKFDFKIESIQSGYPDCTARRKIKGNKYEELKIEFEFESKNFLAHGHDPNLCHIIVCWKHNWADCPHEIEIIELSRLINDLDVVPGDKEEKKLSEWQEFCRIKRLEGLQFKEIAKLWKNKK